MASLDEELRQDALDDLKLIRSIQQQMPERLVGVFTDSTLQFFLDTIAEYYVDNNTFANAGNGGVDVDIMKVAEYVQLCAEKDGLGHFDEADIAKVVEMELNFSEEL